MVILVGMVDSGDEAAKFDGVLWKEKGCEDDALRHIACGTKLKIVAWPAKTLYLCRVLTRRPPMSALPGPREWWLGAEPTNHQLQKRPCCNKGLL